MHSSDIHFNYIETVNTNLVCCICQNPFIDPWVTDCEHTFCRDCITQALSVNLRCPFDRQPLTENNLKPAAAIIRNLVDELIVACPHSASGCSHTCQRQLLATHLSEDCLFVQVNCAHPSCKHTVLRKDIGKHSVDCVHRLVECEACGRDVKLSEMNNHHDECPAREITCVHCNTTLSRSELTTHLSTCHHVPIPCAHSSQGCQWIGTRQIIDQHLQVCPYEAIKGFFTVTATKFQALELENSELRKRLSDLERTCKSQEQDLERAKQRLGTWFKPVSSGAQGIASDSAYNLPRPESSSTIRRTGRRLSAPLHAALFSDQPQATEPGDTSTAGFFPESQILDSSAGPAGATVIPSLRSQPSMPYMRQGGNGSTTSIAPLNFDTTLEATLTSLRNSVVALSSSLDSLERKQDIMLATETLRMHEDVGSLRAIVHGLRMQVHTMMMDRNSQLYGRMGVMGPSSNVLPITGGPNSSGEPSTTYSTVTSFARGLVHGYPRPPHLSPTFSDLDLEPIASVADGTVSSAARYLNHPPPAHFNLSPNVTTSTTSTVRRGFLHENKL